MDDKTIEAYLKVVRLLDTCEPEYVRGYLLGLIHGSSPKDTELKWLRDWPRSEKVGAIKEHRRRYNSGLKEAKDAVEGFWEKCSHYGSSHV